MNTKRTIHVYAQRLFPFVGVDVLNAFVLFAYLYSTVVADADIPIIAFVFTQLNIEANRVNRQKKTHEGIQPNT